jgi:RNA polymerase sigma-70 factor, ECF subfamily
VSERVLTTRELNRALLARQRLLEPSSGSIAQTLKAIGGLQAQYAPSRYIGPWLPDPLVSVTAGGGANPADRVTLEETVSHALLFVLERLTPAERTAFILHDVFGYSFEEVGSVVGRTPAAARQLASRARRHVVQQRPRQSGSPQEQQRAVEAFATAAERGDLEALLAVLDPDVVMRSDGGGRVQAARKPLVGSDRVSRALVAMSRKFVGQSDVRFADVNGLPGLVMVNRRDGQISVLAFTVDAGRITTIHMQRNPDKLGHVVLP